MGVQNKLYSDMNSSTIQLAVTNAVKALQAATDGDFVCVMFVTGTNTNTKVDGTTLNLPPRCKGVVVVHDAASLDLLRSTGNNVR